MDVVPEFEEILNILNRHEVELIVVGGVAAILQGSPLITEDIDVVYLSSEQNHQRLIDALRELKAHYNDPAGRYIEPNASRLATMRMHLLKTRCGRLDVLRSIGENLTYEDLLPRSHECVVAGLRVRALNLEAIIETKEHAGRPKDQHALLFLRQLLHEIKQLEDERTGPSSPAGTDQAPPIRVAP